jgi:ribonucleotide monophosphatase NagD (HAD superfamily)
MNINNISNTYQMSSPYSVILCDLWGVVHNGKEIFQKSRDFLKRVKDVVKVFEIVQKRD